MHACIYNFDQKKKPKCVWTVKNIAACYLEVITIYVYGFHKII